MFAKSLKFSIVLVVLSALWVGQDRVRASQESGDKDTAVFLEMLEGAYRVSCDDVKLLRKYYLEDAEIINNGRQVTLDETIRELEENLSGITKLTCSYEPKVKASRVDKKFAYVVVRETIALSAHEFGERRIDQICTYIFTKNGTIWMISHDHCSSIPGIAV